MNKFFAKVRRLFVSGQPKLSELSVNHVPVDAWTGVADIPGGTLALHRALGKMPASE